jgi:hypothetical protein
VHKLFTPINFLRQEYLDLQFFVYITLRAEPGIRLFASRAAPRWFHLSPQPPHLLSDVCMRSAKCMTVRTPLFSCPSCARLRACTHAVATRRSVSWPHGARDEPGDGSCPSPIHSLAAQQFGLAPPPLSSSQIDPSPQCVSIPSAQKKRTGSPLLLP